MTLRPAPPDLGIVFSRVDLGHRPWVSASWEHARIDGCGTELVNESGVEVMGVEHLMSALCGCAIDNAMIELDGPEVPAMDGSAAPFVFLLECAGATVLANPRRALRIRAPVEIREDGGFIALSPGRGLTLDLKSEAESPAVGRQDWFIAIDPEAYKQEVCRARHFEFLEPEDDLSAREESPDNGVTVLGAEILDERPLRYDNEFVRHEAQCLLGDLYLAGAPIIGQATLEGGARPMTLRLLEKLFSDSGAWSWTDCSEQDLSRPDGERIPMPRAAALGA